LGLGGECGEAKPPEEREPKLPGEYATDEKMLDILLFLITQQTSGWVGEASSSKSVSSPASIVGGQPHEEPTLGRSMRFPYSLCRSKINSPLE